MPLLPPQVLDHDWHGKAVAETSLLTDTLYDLAELDRERWHILAIDAIVTAHGREPRWSIDFYVLDKERHSGALDSNEDKLANLPVKKFPLSELSINDLARVMKSMHFQFRPTHRQDAALDVIEAAEDLSTTSPARSQAWRLPACRQG